MDIPKDLQKATVAIEDERFYSHVGIDFRGIVRALVENLRTGRISQGGSTITQQLARNIYLTKEKKLSRKLQEMVLAIQLERNYSKEEILNLYLNEVYYGSGAYGVQTASRVYFGKQAKDLTLAECAMLAGLPKMPSSLSPNVNLQAAIDRRSTVLKKMAETGCITSEQAQKAKSERVRLIPLQHHGMNNYKAPWFVVYVLKNLRQKYGEDMVYRGGLQVHTTLNYEMQESAEKELHDRVSGAKYRHVSQGALICIDPLNGYIKAMVGGVNPDFNRDQFNRAVQARRQPGSAFKAFVYTAAIDNGYDANYRVSNRRHTWGSGPNAWTPRNFDGNKRGSFTIKQAVAYSVNICAVHMAEQVGIDQVIRYARMMGIKSPLNRNLALALGASEVTPLELCSAYGVFPAKGMRAEPMSIVKITSVGDNGQENIIEDNQPEVHKVLSEQTAKTMNEIFRGVVTSRGGTGHSAGRVPNAHGKTGTTQNDRTAWFVGYTPELVTAVMVCNDDNSPMHNVWGGNVCAPAWSSFMLTALQIHKKEVSASNAGDVSSSNDTTSHNDRNPDRHRRNDSTSTITVKLCSVSGLLASPNCPSTYTTTVARGSEPHERCNIHTGDSNNTGDTTTQPTTTGPDRPGESTENNNTDRYETVTICVDSGQLATQYCPQTIPRRYPIGDAPTKYCRMHRARTE